MTELILITDPWINENVQKLPIPLLFMQRLAIKELVLLPENECFVVKTREYRQLEIPPHFHSEYELNFIENAGGARRIIGYNLDEIAGKELVLIGPGLHHSWQKYHCLSKKIIETTLHFHANLFSDEFLERQPMKNIKGLLANAARGICFSQKTITAIAPLLRTLKTTTGFESLLLVMRILHILSAASSASLLLTETSKVSHPLYSGKIERVLDHVHKHFSNHIKLKEVAQIVNMAEVSFSRFFKQHTGKTFVEFVNEIRIDYASRMLAETTNSIAAIAFSSGFNNISNFNRIFKSKKNLTPKQYREEFTIENVYKMCS